MKFRVVFPANIELEEAIKYSLTLQKSRVPQIQGVKGEAVVIYREPLTTQEMRYTRLSRPVGS